MHFSVRRSSALAFLCAAALTTAACAGGKSVDVGGGSSTGGTRATGGVLIAALNTQPDQLDLQKAGSYTTSEVLENVYDGLVQTGGSLNIVPALATSWTVSRDQLTFTFNLRATKWHDGTPFTSADVVYTYHRLLDNKLPASAAVDAVKSVEADGPDKVVIKAKKPTPSLLFKLTTKIVQKNNIESGAVKTHPVGTGPFKFDSWVQGSSISLSANPDYWGGRPKLAGVKFTFISDPAVSLQSLRSGEIGWTDNLPPQQVGPLENSTSNDFVVQAPAAYGDSWFLKLNTTRKPFDDKRVRQAIAWGIDRTALVKATKFATGEPNQTAIPKTNPWHSDYAPYSRDLAKAKSLLDAAGVHGLKMDFLAQSDYPETITAGQVLASQLAPLGITVKVHSVENNAYYADLTDGKFEVTYDGFAGFIDPSDFYDLANRTGGVNNYQRYSNPVVDKLLDQARVELDQTRRKALYDQAAKIIVDDAAIIYVSDWKVVQGFTKKLHGYTVRPDRSVRFLNASLG